jgi:mRNA interferase MazF
MRAIYLAQMDKTRPVLVLTADRRQSPLRNITIATITTTVWGSVVEVRSALPTVSTMTVW